MARIAVRVGALIVGTLMAGCSVVGGKAAEEPDFTVIESDGPVEIRAYDALTVATTRVAADDRSSAVGRGFGRLFDYISGENTARQDIAMTAPVLTQPADTPTSGESQEIAMTAPVLTQPDGAGWEVVFILPAGMTAETAPVPANPDVRIGTVPARQVAVIRFSGLLSAAAITRERQKLAAWLEARGIAHRGDWQAAGYNPPWTLPPLRRNEVLVTLADQAAQG